MEEGKLKHLEFIQQVITRMSNTSLNVKGLLVTIITAGFIFASKDYSRYAILASIILVVAFSFLDAKYLQYERKYRMLYEKVCKEEFTDMSMSINKKYINDSKFCQYKKCYFSTSVILPYACILIYNFILFGITFICV